MKILHLIIVLAIIFILACMPLASADESAAGNQGWYVIHCNVYGADIYFDDKYVGRFQAGTMTVPASITGTPYKTIRVQRYGYITYTSSLTLVPGTDQTVDLNVTLDPISSITPTQTPVGSDTGRYVVHSNIEGATVLFDGVNMGIISGGNLTVPVYSTGTIYQSYTVQKDGYTTYSGEIGSVPQKGETIDLYSSLNPVAAVLTTPAGAGGAVGWFVVHSNIDGASVSLDNDPMGVIMNGNLLIPVSANGTPYKTFTVYKSGYIPFTSTIDTHPAQNRTVDLYATLNPQTATTPKSMLPPGVSVLALLSGGIAAAVLSRR
ncbi:MAG: PEGA domain-containing protein [Methanoregula sp.]|jgi:hypothetical protein|uniref:PEGA domain-containing protein n=1 Tax=Methanoregula sp. TaxID=2052170 RepID=UPI003D150469